MGSNRAAISSATVLLLALTALTALVAGPASAAAQVTNSATAQAASASAVHPNSTYTICSDWAILPGYAVTAITIDASCTYNESYTIQPAVNNLVVCNSTPVPSPFVVVRITSSGSAPCNGTTDLWTIYTVHDGAYACSGSSIPAGWSYTQITSSAGQCGTLDWEQLHASAAGLRICSTSPYGAGFVVSEIVSSSNCGGPPAYQLATAVNGIQACSPTVIPSGYVVTRADPSSLCGSYYAFTLTQAFDGVVVCPFSPIPAHYFETSPSVPVTNCEGYTAGYKLTYVP